MSTRHIRIVELAREDKGRQFYSIAHLLTTDALHEAFESLRKDAGAGVDRVTYAGYQVEAWKNIQELHARMKSGQYRAQPLRRVYIPKEDGRQRPISIPTVSDRIAQMVVKSRLEPEVDLFFHPDSYGYRPGKSALDTVGQARQRCWRFDWVVDLDIKGFFDNIDHELMMRAVRKHAKDKRVVLYIERWLKAPAQDEEGRLVPREKGTPQGAVATP